MTNQRKPLAWPDGLCVLALIVISASLLFFTLAHGHNWGDDFSVYLSQGIALDQGTFNNQIVQNGQIVSADGPVTYVWGYSLLLSAVHRIVGFDFDQFSSLIYYKVLAAVSLILWGVVLYLFFRRRFSRGIAFVASLVFCANPALLVMCNEILTDIPFALLSSMSLLLMDFFLAQNSTGRPRQWSAAIALGIAMYAAYIIRYAGMVLLAVLLVSHIFYGWYRRQKTFDTAVGTKKQNMLHALYQCLPYLAFLLLYVAVGSFLPYAKTQASDALTITPGGIARNVLYYIYLIRGFVMTMLPFAHGGAFVVYAVLAAVLIGITSCWQREFPAAIYMIGTMAFVVLLPYEQGLRYILNVVPFMLLFSIKGVQWVYRWFTRRYAIAWTGKAWFYVKAALLGLVCLTVIIASVRQAYGNMKAERQVPDGAYSEDAKTMYRYIREMVPVHQPVAFSKGRALSLNTGRVCYSLHPTTIDSLDKADYLLTSDEPAAALLFDVWETLRQKHIETATEHEAGSMTLYRLIHK